MVTQTMFSGCWAVRDFPTVWEWNFSRLDSSHSAPYHLSITRAHTRRKARNFVKTIVGYPRAVKPRSEGFEVDVDIVDDTIPF